MSSIVYSDATVLHSEKLNPMDVTFVWVHFQGYALLCVGYPSSDVEVETQDEDEVSTSANLSSEDLRLV
jgi:hypothetical protein